MAGRLYHASYRHMAHFTLLLCLFVAAAYKSEVRCAALRCANPRCAVLHRAVLRMPWAAPWQGCHPVLC